MHIGGFIWIGGLRGVEEYAVRVDRKGRILIPKSLRERIGVKEGGYVRVVALEKKIVVEPVETLADRYFGAFKIERWPSDLDEFLVRVAGEWWSREPTST